MEPQGLRRRSLVLGRLCLLFLLLSLLGAMLFLAMEADHPCSGGHHCPICLVMEQCGQTLRLVGGGTSPFVRSCVFPLLLAAVLLPLSRLMWGFLTPCERKVRMNN
ncbi:MAG: hypothetical protein SPF89_10235 [Sphaerochaetaceae bacterium]|nr:hypothetical protein [Spirochaetales bacterium]MDY5500470.1 hypothetical protein [Sphaerochaetaceae bacterium]